MKRSEKITAALIFIIAYLIVSAMINRASAQSKVHLMAGYKSIEAGYSFENEEFLNFGFSVSAADSKMLEKRANKNDVNRNIHEFKTSVVPALFGTLGANFDNFIITGKVGGSYVEQEINDKNTKDLFFAVGMSMEYQINDSVGFKASYDNVNAVMAGITFKF